MPRLGARHAPQHGQASAGRSRPGRNISRFGGSSLTASTGLPFGLMPFVSFVEVLA
jgi:hypothetical protein